MGNDSKQAIANSGGGSIGICGFMFLIFMTLKLCGVIAWSWWWVTAPLWIPFAIFFGIALPILIVMIVIAIIVGTRRMFS